MVLRQVEEVCFSIKEYEEIMCRIYDDQEKNLTQTILC